MESLVLLDLPEQKAHLDSQGFLGHQVSLVVRVSVVRQEHPDLKVTEDWLDFRELKVNLVTKVSEVSKVILVYQVCLDQLERKAKKDQWDFLDTMALKDQEVTKDPLDPLDSEVLLDLPEMLELQEHLGSKDHQGSQEIQDDLALKVKLVQPEKSSTQLAPLLLASQDHLGLLVLPALQDLQDYQVPLVLLVCLANLVLKVTEDIRETQENQE